MGLEDLAAFRAVHSSTVLYPSDANQAARLVGLMADLDGIAYLRTHRGALPVIYGPDEEFEVGGSRVLREGDDITLVGAGVTLHEALRAADELARRGMEARVIDLYSVKPVDAQTLVRAAAETGAIVTAEDHWPEGGLGEAVLSALADAGSPAACVSSEWRSCPAPEPPKSCCARPVSTPAPSPRPPASSRAPGPPPEKRERTIMSNLLREIEALGQSIWIDNLNRQLLDDGTLRHLIEDDGISGVTSNPTIFEKGMGNSDRYDDAFREVAADTDDPQEIFERLAYRDVLGRLRAAAARSSRRAAAQDGYVSFELPASLAFDTEGSVEAAVRHRDALDRPNVFIKVPGTEPGVRAFEELTARGVNVNVTLLFAVERYREVAEAYLRGLERRVEAGEPVDRSASVASFFVSRVDSKVDKVLEEKGREDLRGKAAVANAKLAYAAFQEIFAGERWERLRTAGANVQRPLWGSTSTKNPDYPDTLYVDELIGPDTVNTMPDATIEAARDHATPERTVDRDVDAARELMSELESIGIDLDDIVLRQLVDEGVQAFADSYESLLDSLRRKAGELSGAAAR